MRGISRLLALLLLGRRGDSVRPLSPQPPDAQQTEVLPRSGQELERPLHQLQSSEESEDGELPETAPQQPAEPEKPHKVRQAPSSADLAGFGAFVINLDTNTKRLEGFRMSAAKSEPWLLDVLHRVPGINGVELLANESNRQELIQAGLIRPDDLERALQHDKGAGHWEDISPGAVGLYLAHARAWQEIVDRGLRYGLIFEDDLRFYSKDFEPTMMSLLRGETQADISYFQHCLDSSSWPPGAEMPESDRLPFARPVADGELVPCLAAYVLSNRGARRVLQENFPIRQQLDMAVSNASIWEGLTRTVYEPALAQVGPESYSSTVQENSMCQQFGWKMVSFLGMWSRHLFYPWCAI